MTKTVADILVEVGGDVTPLTRALKKGGRDLDTFGKRAARTGKQIAKVGAAMAAALTVGATASVGLARRSADAAVEVDRLARVAGTTSTEFQRMAAAAQTVGISQEKLSDILKDVNDRVGDFLATGGGPMADFFERIAPQVGVTADQFARLSGPEALQLYVSSLEKANVTQAEMTFYLEAMASDTTALLPLLRDGGREFERLGDRAADAGRVMSGETLNGADRLDQKLDELQGTLRNEVTTAMIGMEDELVVLAEFVRDFGVPALEALIKGAAAAADAIRTVQEAMAFLRDPAGVAGGNIAAGLSDRLGLESGQSPSLDPIDDAGALKDPNVERRLHDLYGSDGAGDSPGIKPGAPILPHGIPDDIPPGLNNRDPATLGYLDDSGESGGGGGYRGPTEDDLAALEQSLATERELLAIDYQEKLDQLEEFRAGKVGKEEEWNELEARIQKEHLEKMRDLEAAEQRARLQSVAGMFGDLSSLMSSENDKLFKIGKASAIAEATVSGYQAAVSAWEKGMKIGGPPAAAAFTAASLARTGALISSIASTNANGSGGGRVASVATSQAAAAPEAASPQQVNLNIGDAELFSRSSVLALAEQLQELSREGAIVTVN